VRVDKTQRATQAVEVPFEWVSKFFDKIEKLVSLAYLCFPINQGDGSAYDGIDADVFIIFQVDGSKS
jgi:hypothetical protein